MVNMSLTEARSTIALHLREQVREYHLEFAFPDIGCDISTTGLGIAATGLAEAIASVPGCTAAMMEIHMNHAFAKLIERARRPDGTVRVRTLVVEPETGTILQRDCCVVAHQVNMTEDGVRTIFARTSP